MASEPNLKNRKVLGKGSFGCVVSPALPNRNRNGTRRNYPSNVTKLFKNRNTRNNSYQKSKKAQRLFGDLPEHRINLYETNSYTWKGLPKSLQNSCGYEPDEDEDEIYSLRMPNLGVSFRDAGKSPAILAQLRALDPTILVNQAVKLIRQVYRVYSQGYIHGDIRELNVMIEPTSGNMVIVDFDWLYPIEDFFTIQYSDALGYYSNPPEALLNGTSVYSWISKKRTFHLDRIKKQSLKTYIQLQNGLAIPGRPSLTEDTLKGILTAFLPLMQDEKFKETQSLLILMDLLKSQFDSFGLGFTLIYLFSRVYHDRIPANVYTLLSNILLPMCDFTYASRIDIVEAHRRAQELFPTAGAGAGAGAGSGSSVRLTHTSTGNSLALSPSPPPTKSRRRKTRKALRN